MAITQVIRNGQLVDTSATGTSVSESKQASGSNLDKEAFLQLLVAQMKYQDPLEPTDNTEYVAQLATFSQLEATQNLEATNERQMANDLIGKEVILNVTDKSGKQSYVHGKVDYTMFEEGKIFLSVNNKLYSIDDLDTVVDEQYYEASNKSENFLKMLAKLPAVNKLTITDGENVKAARAYYDEMNDYEKSFISEDYVNVLKKLEDRLAEITKAIEG